MNDSSPQWFFGQSGQQHGPVSTDALRQMLREKKISSADLVWREGMSDWRVIAGLPEFANPNAPLPPSAPPPAVAAPVPAPYGAHPYPGQYGAQPVGYRSAAAPIGASSNGLAVAGFVLAFCVPLAGLIISI